MGLPVMELDGGLEAWRQTGKPIQKGAPRKPAPRKPAQVKPPDESVEMPAAEIAAATQSEEAPAEAMSVGEAN